MAIWKTLRTVYLVFLFFVAAAAAFWGYPLYRYLKNPVTVSAESVGSATPQATAVDSAQETGDAGRAINPRSLLGVNAATIPKFEGMVRRVAPGSAEAWIGLGILYQYKDLLPEALRCYQKAVELEPDHADAHYRLGTAYHAQNRLEDAIAQYNTAIRVKPSYLYAYYGLATVYQLRGNEKEAEALYHDILGINPREYQAYNNLGILYEEQGRFEEALAQYEKAASLNPNDPTVKNNVEMARREIGTEAVSPSVTAKAPAPTPPLFSPEHVSTIFLKNKRVMSGEIVSRDAGGIWFRIDEGVKVYFSNQEIERVE